MIDGFSSPDAGRELDMLVAERVMGLKRHFWEKRLLVDQCANCHTTKKHGLSVPLLKDYCNNQVPRAYSNRIEAAWDVVERVTDEEKMSWGAVSHFATWFDQNEIWALSAEEAAERICQVAVRAVAENE